MVTLSKLIVVIIFAIYSIQIFNHYAVQLKLI